MAHQSGDRYRTSDHVSDRRVLVDLARRVTEHRHLIVATNRGPLNFIEEQSGEISARRDTSRTTEMFEFLSDTPIKWISGVAGAVDRKAVEQMLGTDGYIRSEAIPPAWAQRFVSSPRRVHHKFYNVICNPLLWFMLHRSWSPTFTPNIGEQEHDAWERGYRAVNEAFAAEVSIAAGEDEIVLVCRDYQLMLVPGIVRLSHPDAIIHFSLDTPWPWPSEFELLPASWRTELLESLLSSDVISLPSSIDIAAFVACSKMFLGERVEVADASDGVSLSFNGRTIHLRISPFSVRSKKFSSTLEFAPTQRMIGDLKNDQYSHTFVTVDRSEPHKNIIRSITAFGELLKQNPDLVGKVRFLLFLTPGPAHISAYKRLSDEIRRIARSVNDRTNDAKSVQVHLENNFYRAIAGLSQYDTLVSVPVVDGISRVVLDGPLVNDKDGGMIISETMSATKLLSDHASVVSFTDVQAITRAMAEAVSESASERAKKSANIRQIVLTFGSEEPMLRTIEAIAEVDDRG
ncbi:trehalose-6-phosphate synthase [Dehalococcoides mccartyi]|nr:trehalose-6-phosphate synthase [Dehalococcoides mccartyi]